MGMLSRQRGFLPFVLLSLLIIGCGSGKQFQAGGAVQNLASADCIGCHPAVSYTYTSSYSTLNSHLDNAIANSPIEGYVLNSPPAWAPEGMGYVSKNNPGACASSCHNEHASDMSINRAWAKSGHADANSEPFKHDFTGYGVCLRCHSAIGFANFVDAGNTTYPQWNQPVGNANTVAHHITCLGCHDGTAFPTNNNPLLRMRGGIANMISGSGATMTLDAALNVGTSFSCVNCHQGRESGGSVYKKMRGLGADPYADLNAPIFATNFVNPHYRGAGATLFSLKGFEFNGSSYTTGNSLHQTMLCVGCHMAGSADEDLGGHTFAVRYPASGTMQKSNVSVCKNCHGPSITSILQPGGLWDVDGDGIYGTPKEEIESLKAKVINGLMGVTTPAGTGIYYNPVNYPYFFNSPGCFTSGCYNKDWSAKQFGAAFNLKMIDAEPGAYAHNFKYSSQLLRDSYEKITNTNLPGARPSGNDRPATIYTFP